MRRQSQPCAPTKTPLAASFLASLPGGVDDLVRGMRTPLAKFLSAELGSVMAASWRVSGVASGTVTASWVGDWADVMTPLTVAERLPLGGTSSTVIFLTFVVSTKPSGSVTVAVKPSRNETMPGSPRTCETAVSGGTLAPL